MASRMFRSVSFFVLLAMTCVTASVGAQSLADAARKANESSSSPKGPSRTFTDKDLKSASTEDGLITPGGDAEEGAPPGPVLSREDIVRRIMPAVVTIQAGNATGTGFFVDRGLVLTNHHVVGESVGVRVHLSDGTNTTGQVSRLVADVDLALVSVDVPGSRIVPVTLGSYRQL